MPKRWCALRNTVEEAKRRTASLEQQLASSEAGGGRRREEECGACEATRKEGSLLVRRAEEAERSACTQVQELECHVELLTTDLTTSSKDAMLLDRYESESATLGDELGEAKRELQKVRLELGVSRREAKASSEWRLEDQRAGRAALHEQEEVIQRLHEELERLKDEGRAPREVREDQADRHSVTASGA